MRVGHGGRAVGRLRWGGGGGGDDLYVASWGGSAPPPRFFFPSLLPTFRLSWERWVVNSVHKLLFSSLHRAVRRGEGVPQSRQDAFPLDYGTVLPPGLPPSVRPRTRPPSHTVHLVHSCALHPLAPQSPPASSMRGDLPSPATPPRGASGSRHGDRIPTMSPPRTPRGEGTRSLGRRSSIRLSQIRLTTPSGKATGARRNER